MRRVASPDSFPSCDTERVTGAFKRFKRQSQSIYILSITKRPQQGLRSLRGLWYAVCVVKRTRAVHPAFTTKERGDAMSVSDAISLISCVISLISLLISVYLLGRDQ